MDMKSYPTRVRFFIADDIRADGKKPMIIGLLTDDIVGIEIPENHPEPSSANPIILQSLAILISFINCHGPFEAKASLYRPDGAAAFEHHKLDGWITSDAPAIKGNINFILKFIPFGISQFGQYRFSVTLDDQEYNYDFTVKRINQPKN